MLAILAGLVLASSTPDLSLKAPQIEQTAMLAATCAIKAPASEKVVQANCVVGALRQGDVVGVAFILEGGSLMFIGTEDDNGALAVDSMVVSDVPYAATGACAMVDRTILCGGSPVGVTEPVVIRAVF